MKPIQTPRTNATLTSEQEGVDALPVERLEGICLSTWEPDDGERVRIAEGASIELAVWGDKSQPPVSVVISPPYCPKCDERMVWSTELQTWTCGHNEGGADGSG